MFACHHSDFEYPTQPSMPHRLCDWLAAGVVPLLRHDLWDCSGGLFLNMHGIVGFMWCVPDSAGQLWAHRRDCCKLMQECV
jgi:hypothetical protein